MEKQVNFENKDRNKNNKKNIIIASIIFVLFFIVGYIGGTMVSYDEKWPGAGPTFWDALKPF